MFRFFVVVGCFLFSRVRMGVGTGHKQIKPQTASRVIGKAVLWRSAVRSYQRRYSLRYTADGLSVAVVTSFRFVNLVIYWLCHH